MSPVGILAYALARLAVTFSYFERLFVFEFRKGDYFAFVLSFILCANVIVPASGIVVNMTADG